MAITASTREEAWELALLIFPGCRKKNVAQSKCAGYDIYADEDGNTISDLTVRLEVNFDAYRISKNIWIASEVKETKSREEIEQRIASIKQQIECAKEDISKATKELSEKVAKYVDDPIYIARWIEDWMRPITSAEAVINELCKTMVTLAWVLNKE